jgi:hypothetical protein
MTRRHLHLLAEYFMIIHTIRLAAQSSKLALGVAVQSRH